MVEQLARFLGVSCDKAQLEALSEHCHQLVDQCCNAEALPVGRGTRPPPPPPPGPWSLPWASCLQSPLLRESRKVLRKPGAVGGDERGARGLLALHCDCASGLGGHRVTVRMLWALWARHFKQAPSQTAPQHRPRRGLGAVRWRSPRHAALSRRRGVPPPPRSGAPSLRTGCPCRAGRRSPGHSCVLGTERCEAEDMVQAGALCRFARVAVCPSKLSRYLKLLDFGELGR